jgi:OH-DDVA oxygenase
VAIANVVTAMPGALRVAVVASGGLSHFVVDETLDRRVLAALARGDAQALCGLPRAALNSGSSEILNWVAAAGALAALPLQWSDYQPLYRTPAGTGVGAAFALWGAA